jgi:hypothetical protein
VNGSVEEEASEEVAVARGTGRKRREAPRTVGVRARERHTGLGRIRNAGARRTAAVSAMADSADAVGTLARFRVRRGTATRAGGTRL